MSMLFKSCSSCWFERISVTTWALSFCNSEWVKHLKNSKLAYLYIISWEKYYTLFPSVFLVLNIVRKKHVIEYRPIENDRKPAQLKHRSYQALLQNRGHFDPRDEEIYAQSWSEDLENLLKYILMQVIRQVQDAGCMLQNERQDTYTRHDSHAGRDLLSWTLGFW